MPIFKGVAMSDFVQIFRFGWPYLKKYRFRLVMGVLLGILFGLSNATFVWATSTLVKRMMPPQQSQVVVASNTVVNVTVATNAPPGFKPRLVQNGDAPAEFLIRTNTSLEFVVTNTAAVTPPASLKSQLAQKAKTLARSVNAGVNDFIDPWLPRNGRALDWRQILGGFCLLPFLVAFRSFIGYLSSYCLAWVSEQVIRDLRIDLLAKLNTLSMNYYNRVTTGEILARMNGDTGALYRCLSLGFSDLIKEPITILSLLLALLGLNWKLTILAIIFTPLSLIPIKILGKKVKKAITTSLGVGMSQDSLLVEVYTNMRVVKAFSMESFQLARFRKLYEGLARMGMKSTQARELVNPLVETISMFGLGVVIIFIFKNNVTLDNLMGFLMGVTAMFQPVKKLGGIHIYVQQASVGATRLMELFKEVPSVQEKPDAVRVPEFKKELSFEHITFAYRKNKPVVKDFHLTVPRGQKLGIAGESGSGKSTLVSLIFRFYDPTEGVIKIDGHDLRDVAGLDLRQHLALVSQDIMIFDQTVAENIACGREGATREEIIEAAKAAYAHDFITKLPEGYDTRLGEKGGSLSGGQRQRICIARAFVRNAAILVLDEATAPLDPKTEAEVQVAIDRLTEGRTVICIAHRLSTLTNMDKIIVMDKGEIVETGTFKELLRQNGVFADMARKQGMAAAQI